MGDTATLERRGRWAAIAVGAVLVTDLVAIWSDWLQMRLLDRAIDGDEIALSTFDSDDGRQAVVALLQILVFVVAVVFFLRWFHRAYVDLPRLGAERRFKSGWAIGAWFVPILNLWRPKQIANDLWRGTEPVPGAARSTATGANSSWLPNVWWAGFLIVGAAEIWAGIAYLDAPFAVDVGPLAAAGLTEGAEDVRSAARTDLIASVVSIAVAVVTILVVRALTARYVRRVGAVGESAPAPAPSPSVADAPTLERRGRWAAIALAAVLVTDVIGIWSDWLQIRLLDRAIDGEDIALSTFEGDDNRQIVVVLLQAAALVAAVVLFLRWFYRAYVDLPHLGATRRFGTRWAIGAWFVPLLNIWRPKQIADDIWRGTDPGAEPIGTGSWGWRSSWLINAWWISWIALTVLETRAGIAFSSAPWAVDAGPPAAVGLTEGAEQTRSAAILDLAASLADIPVAVLAIVVVRALTARLVERTRLLRAMTPPIATTETETAA